MRFDLPEQSWAAELGQATNGLGRDRPFHLGCHDASRVDHGSAVTLSACRILFDERRKETDRQKCL